MHVIVTLNVLGWIIWSIIFLLALSWTFGVRDHVSKGLGIPHATAVQVFFLWAIVLVFRFFSFSKLHILWAAPVCFIASIYLTLARRVPILTPVVLWFAGLCMGIALVGVKRPSQQMTYHVGICEASDIYGDRYGDCRVVVIWQSEKDAVSNTGIGSFVPRGTPMKIFGASVIDTKLAFSKEAIAKASPDELLSMADVAIDHAYQLARQRALRNVVFWKRWWLGRKVDSIWRGQSNDARGRGLFRA